MFQGSVKGVSRKIEGRFKVGLRVSKRSSKDLLREFHDSFNDVLRKF